MLTAIGHPVAEVVSDASPRASVFCGKYSRTREEGRIAVVLETLLSKTVWVLSITPNRKEWALILSGFPLFYILSVSGV